MEKVLNQPEMHPPHKDQGGGSSVVRLFFLYLVSKVTKLLTNGLRWIDPIQTQQRSLTKSALQRH